MARKVKNICFTPLGCEDYTHWVKQDRKTLKRINSLINEIIRNPFSGMGKPEALRFDLSGYWSRRIDSEHRLVYRVDGERLVIIQCRYDYKYK